MQKTSARTNSLTSLSLNLSLSHKSHTQMESACMTLQQAYVQHLFYPHFLMFHNPYYTVLHICINPKLHHSGAKFRQEITGNESSSNLKKMIYSFRPLLE